MRAIFGCSVVTFVMLGSVMVSTASLAASKPEGGYCECGQYVEVPVLCKNLTGSELDACRKSNTQWFRQCGAWQDQMCHAEVSSPVTKPMELSHVRLALSPEPTSLPQFVGSWSGQAKCPSSRKARLTMTITKDPDGSNEANASNGGIGDFSKITLQGDTVVLLYSSWLKDTTYTGRLVSPNRIEGTFTLGENCTWYMTK